MDASELPETCKGFTVSDKPSTLAIALEWALDPFGNKTFYHIEPITGTSRSGRVVFTKEESPSENSIPFDSPLSAKELAREFFSLIKEARFDPPENEDSKKGWRVCTGVMKEQMIVVVWADWTTVR